jgi:hypothetical protein
MRRRITIACLALAAVALLVPAAGAAARTPAPKITRVSPMRVKIGSVVVVRGRHFSSVRRRNTVIFRAPNGRTAFVKPRRASRRKLVVRVPAIVARLLSRRSGRTAPTRFKLRVVTRRRYSRYTPRRLSPVVAPVSGAGSTGSVCAGDFDGDLLTASFESGIGTDPCLADTDGDGVEDGYEYRSAVDLNNDDYQHPNQSLPYPGQRPYPNALDPSDGGVDYDGDTLGQNVEQRLWKYSDPAPRTLSPLTYSDGLQHSIYSRPYGDDRRAPALPAAGYSKQASFRSWAASRGYRFNVYLFGGSQYDLFDFNLSGAESAAELAYYDVDNDGWLSDDERDEDADGLTNWDENTGRLVAAWWTSCYVQEKPYYVRYAGTNPADADSDGDGVRDGADDQDHDDLPNVMELSRVDAFNKFGAVYAGDPLEGSGDDREPVGSARLNCKVSKGVKDAISGIEPPIYWHASAYGRVNPFNPCLPSTSARTCNTYSSFSAPWAPFDGSPNWFALN